ncbi:MAG: tetratricopeptide repeat protein [Nitrospirae bacterium]|nr:tetratricopeptide repeat protein [Nitrospirota bacterium]
MKYGVFVLTVICLLISFSAGSASEDKCAYYVEQNEFDSALIICSDDIDKFNSPKRMADTYMNRGIVYIGKNNYPSAIADFTKAIEIYPKGSIYYVRRGKAYHDKDKFSEAIADFTKAIEVNPKDETIYNLRGLAYMSKGDKDLASADFRKAIQLNPKYCWPYYRIASIYAMDERAAESCEWLKKAADAGFDRWGYLRNDAYFEPIRHVKCFKEFIAGK